MAKRYQGDNQKSYIKGQTIQWLKEKEQKTNDDLQNTAQKTKDCETRDPLKTGSELMCSGRVGSSSSKVLRLPRDLGNFYVISIWFFTHSRLITGFVTN
jgi:hypothetical protein